MLIVCPQCATSYKVEPQSLGPDGRSVRCARCQNVWFAAATAVLPAFATVEDFDLIDTGPKIPSFDARRPAGADASAAVPVGAEAQTQEEPAETGLRASPEIAEAAGAAPEESAGTGASQAVEEEISGEGAAADAAIPDGAETTQPEPASTEGIDLEGLKRDMEMESAAQTAEADAVLAVVAEAHVAMEDAPPLAPAMQPIDTVESDAAAAVSNAAEDIESFAARRERQARRRDGRHWAAPGLPAIILLLAAANAILLAWRTDVVRLMPQAASLYASIGLPVNLRGLDFKDIRISKEEQDGMPVLVVEGSIVNVSRRAVEVPRVRLAVRNEGKSEIYSWTALPPRSVLASGETLPFQARLASPPAETRDVLVRFFTRRDIVAGLP